MLRLPALLFLLMAPSLSTALELAMPAGSRLALDEVSEEGSYALPDGPFLDGYLSSRKVNGHVSRQVWHLPGDQFTTEQLVAPLRSQLEAAGFAIMLDCDAASCGGFDFRFATDVLPAPDMFVDLVNYRFLSALKDSSSGVEAVSALVSFSDIKGYTQLIAVQPGLTSDDLPLATSTDASTSGQIESNARFDNVSEVLVQNGHVVLSDLKFETGSSNLAEGQFASLQALADFMAANPNTRIALVGHTDNVGSLENNVALSEKRAAAVKAQLVDRFAITAARIEAQGVGYLSPIASNQSEDGRNTNRRVDAVLLAE